MKIAITSRGSTVNAMLDEHFGRCAYFMIYDTSSDIMEIIPNPYKDSDENAGYQAFELLRSRGVEKVVSGDFGLKIKKELDKHRIQMIVFRRKIRIREILKLLNHKS